MIFYNNKNNKSESKLNSFILALNKIINSFKLYISKLDQTILINVIKAEKA